jgi:putative transcriptional regulator
MLIGGYMRNIISDLRERHHITQQQLADMVQVSRQTIISLERDKYNPSILLAHKIAQVFHRNIEEIFIFEESSSHR